MKRNGDKPGKLLNTVKNACTGITKRVKTVHLFLILIFFAVVSTMMTSGTLAKYASSFSGAGSLQVAAFAGGGVVDFTVDVDNIAPGETKTVTFAVKNYNDAAMCEVAMDYEIRVETTGNLPLEFSLSGVKEGGSESALTGAVSGVTDTSFTASGGRFLPVATDGQTTHEYTLSAFWPVTDADDDYSSEIDMLTVTVTAVQVNPGEAVVTE